MTYVATPEDDIEFVGKPRFSGGDLLRLAFGGIAGSVFVVVAWTTASFLVEDDTPEIQPAPTMQQRSASIGPFGSLDGIADRAADGVDAAAIFAPPSKVVETNTPKTAPAPVPLPPQRSATVDENVPLPPTNPFRAARGKGDTRQAIANNAVSAPRAVGANIAPTENRSLLSRIFGSTTKEKDPAETGQMLAYAKPDDEVRTPSPALPQPAQPSQPALDARTAVYDIDSKIVYMPDGSRLEAHSGLGGMLDDVNSVQVKNRGATPPNIYDLTLREKLFHGVAAIRMTPIDGVNKYNRDGLLVHTYMLGPNGDSNGCVSVRDYDAFLNAFRRGEIRRLVVVTQGGASVSRSILASR